MKKTLFLLFLCMATSIANAQFSTSSLRKNVVKFNILPPLLGSMSEVSYERFVKPNLSITAGFGTNMRRTDRTDFQLIPYGDLAFLNTDMQNRYFLAEVRRTLISLNAIHHSVFI